MGRSVNQIRRLCGLGTQSNVSVNTSNTDCSSANSFSSAEDITSDPNSSNDNSHHISTDSEDDNIVWDISVQADKPRFCPAKQAHKLVLGKTYASLVKRFITTSDAPHLDSKALVQKLDEVAKTVDLDVSTFLTEQSKDPVLLVLYVLGFVKTLLLILSHQRSNNQMVSYDNFKIITDLLLKKKDSSFAITNHRTN